MSQFSSERAIHRKRSKVDEVLRIYLLEIRSDSAGGIFPNLNEFRCDDPIDGAPLVLPIRTKTSVDKASCENYYGNSLIHIVDNKLT